MGKLFSKLRLKTVLRSDRRIRILNEIIVGMKVIKLYAWEKPFSKLIEHCRRLVHISY